MPVPAPAEPLFTAVHLWSWPLPQLFPLPAGLKHVQHVREALRLLFQPGRGVGRLSKPRIVDDASAMAGQPCLEEGAGDQAFVPNLAREARAAPFCSLDEPDSQPLRPDGLAHIAGDGGGEVELEAGRQHDMAGLHAVDHKIARCGKIAIHRALPCSEPSPTSAHARGRGLVCRAPIEQKSPFSSNSTGCLRKLSSM